MTDNLGINAPNRIEIGHFINRIDRLIWFEIKSRLGIKRYPIFRSNLGSIPVLERSKANTGILNTSRACAQTISY